MPMASRGKGRSKVKGGDSGWGMDTGFGPSRKGRRRRPSTTVVISGGQTRPVSSLSRTVMIVIVAVIALVVVGILVMVVLLGSLTAGIPVDVYAKPTPDATVSPESILPDSIIGKACEHSENSTAATYTDATARYEGSLIIEVTCFYSVVAAKNYVESGYSYYSAVSGSRAYVNVGGQHWFTYDGGGESVFAWRKDCWVFVVTAPDKSTRNSAADALPY